MDINPQLNQGDRFEIIRIYETARPFLIRRGVPLKFAREQADMLLADRWKMHDYEEAAKIVHGLIRRDQANAQSDPRNIPLMIEHLGIFSAYLMFRVSELIIHDMKDEHGLINLLGIPYSQTNDRGKVLLEKLQRWLEHFCIAAMKPHAERGKKVLRASKDGHEAVHGTHEEKQAKREAYRLLLKELRTENPDAKPRKIYELAEAVSESRFGKRVSYKTFYRLENTPK